MASATTVPKLYYGVIDEVIQSVRDAFIDEGMDEQTLAELKQIWEKKLVESKVIEKESEPVVSRPVVSAQPQTTHVTSAGNFRTPMNHHLTMPATNLLPQTVLQYSANSAGDGPKALALNLNPKVTLTVPAHMAQSGLQALVAGPGTTVQLPQEFASLLQSNFGGQQVQYQALTQEQLQKAQQFTVTIPVTAPQQQNSGIMGQLDGAQDTSDEDDEDDYNDNDDDGDENDDEHIDDDGGEEEDEDPLNSGDDVSDEDPTDLFDTENVVVCQYDKITRSKNRWKFHLKDGIMNLKGKDFVFQKALGDSEW